ncbi:spermatogenesis-associated protein 48 isoform X1 [Mauremys reevesii]|uniref:spermatogenesis-associated protein 48 isoform X1 n=1 Tax=Mauremys reevesii TaxID=260615 RepID=UPI00193FA9C7|nr:spermatogenesis-associated protein 48 isoform X1 [Mauremys reevesii]XP_039382692.1 spermatogenesis-associated protein 48 isoform X1 [Mauremys reevesii]XP_039382693.1 spermatogenesis-associated protein 48 isoform X1 [Mauremys reevesii]
MTLVSQGAERQVNAFKSSSQSAEPLHKMDHHEYRSLLKKMYMPFVRGPDDKHDFASFQEKDSNSFLKFNPYSPPVGPDYPLFPHRDNVPLADPCSGFMSPGADADLQPCCGRTIDSLVDYSDVKPHQRVPLPKKTAQTAHTRHVVLLEEVSQDRRWNSRAVSDASIRARLGGWTSPMKVTPASSKQRDSFQIHSFAFHVDPKLKKSSDPPSASWREEKARDYFYISSTQKAYEEVPWDKILPPKIPQPESTVEMMADPISQCFTIKRYNPAPEISQVVGGLWDRFQTRYFTSPQKPIDFVSPSSRTQHIPLYTGCIGAENFEDLDNASVDVITLGSVRTSKPRYTRTAHTPNIPGYTGKVHWTATHPANSNLPSTSPSIIAQMHGYIAKCGHSSRFNHQGPLSQILTPVYPQNSFNKVERETIKV